MVNPKIEVAERMCIARQRAEFHGKQAEECAKKEDSYMAQIHELLRRRQEDELLMLHFEFNMVEEG